MHELHNPIITLIEINNHGYFISHTYQNTAVINIFSIA